MRPNVASTCAAGPRSRAASWASASPATRIVGVSVDAVADTTAVIAVVLVRVLQEEAREEPAFMLAARSLCNTPLTASLRRRSASCGVHTSSSPSDAGLGAALPSEGPASAIWRSVEMASSRAAMVMPPPLQWSRCRVAKASRLAAAKRSPRFAPSRQLHSPKGGSPSPFVASFTARRRRQCLEQHQAGAELDTAPAAAPTLATPGLATAGSQHWRGAILLLFCPISAMMLSRTRRPVTSWTTSGCHCTP
mmetsp:Transcript_60900/g.133913  ORF Transcript_60900/g.133913 Transcript_60900/m.133913 type:complete len:250 (-) Transcript_60900:677-1426(-)